MKLRKRLIYLLLVFVFISGSVIGCAKKSNSNTEATSNNTSSKVTVQATVTPAPVTSGAQNTSEEVTLTYVAGKDDSGATQQIIEAFQTKYPNIKIDFQELPGNSDDVKKSISTSLAAGDSSPDVFSADIIWISQFASAGWLLDVTNEVSAIKDQYLSGPVLTTEYNGKNYAFPSYTDVGLLYYRKDLVETPPKTWDELVALSKEHIGKDGIEYGYVFQAFQGEPVVCNSLEFIKQNGGVDLVDGKFQINSKNAVDALKFMRSLIDEGISPEGVLTHKPEDTRAIFEEGKALFMRNWTYAYALANAETSKVAGKVGVTTLPVGPDGTSSSGTIGGWDIAINSKTEHKDAAILFAQYLSGAEAQKIRTVVASTFPTNKAVYEDEEIKAAAPYLADLAIAFDQAQPRPQVSDYAKVSGIIQEYTHKALTLDLDYETALNKLNDALNQAIAK